jgi:hypothetical protein
MIRNNPKYDNICWTRTGMYRGHACEKCTKKEECDVLYNERSGDWAFRDQKGIRIPVAKNVVKIKIRNRLIPVAKWVLNKNVIKEHVDELINQNGAIFSDELKKSTGLANEVLYAWLRHNGFTKWAKHSKRWENKDYLKGIEL